MLQWTAAGTNQRFSLLVHHTDAKREYAYDKGATKVLQAAQQNQWIIVDMKNDWKVIFPPETNNYRTSGRRGNLLRKN
ncbi:MAG TPA: hypothetical protein VHO70_19940 [Chitinispirillaceae bacterium]|nr:hypothetical protein [Chitinispirillaceae bacterium]